MDGVTTAERVAASRSGFGGIDFGAQVDTVLVGLIVAAALIYLLAWAIVATNKTENLVIDHPVSITVLAALAPLLLVFVAILTIRVVAVLN
jgi:uncharacterized membrane protein YhdT